MATAKTPKAAKAASKKTRPAEGASRAKRPGRTKHEITAVLNPANRPGYVRRWEHDIDDRVARMLAMGWEPVMQDVPIGDRMAGEDSSLGKLTERNVGGGVKAILLEMPEDLYNNRQRVKRQARIDLLAATKKGGADYEIDDDKQRVF